MDQFSNLLEQQVAGQMGKLMLDNLAYQTQVNLLNKEIAELKRQIEELKSDDHA